MLQVTLESFKEGAFPSLLHFTYLRLTGKWLPQASQTKDYKVHYYYIIIPKVVCHLNWFIQRQVHAT